MKVDIDFDELLQLVNQLPKKQLAKLRSLLDSKTASNPPTDSIKAFLLQAPVFDKNQLEQVKMARKAINQWRTK